MRVTLKELLEKLGVMHVLTAYETRPWFHYDDDQGITCSAEVRMGPGASILEAEIQFLYDEPPENLPGNGPQVMYMQAKPTKTAADEWSPVGFSIKGKNYVNEIYDWEEKGCSFFRMCIQAVQMGELPNIEELEKQQMIDDGDGRGGRGKIGRKAPKIKPAQLLGVKKPM